MENSYGFIETRGYIGAVEAADAMLKAANVKLVKWHKVGSGLIIVIIKGELGACQAAVEAGKVAAETVGDLAAFNVIARPYDDLGLFFKANSAKKRKKQSRTKEKPAREPVSAKTTEKKDDKQDNLADLLKLVKAAPKGLTLQSASQHLPVSAAELRILFKELMDAEKIVKVHQHYYPFQKRGIK